jgi:hypothetical protein
MNRTPTIALLLMVVACSANHVGVESDQAGKSNTNQSTAVVVESAEASGPGGLPLRNFEFDTVTRPSCRYSRIQPRTLSK